jgi:DNA-binding transcriptional MerR regulator
MKQQDDYFVTVGDVADRFGVSTSRGRQLDDELQPRRHPNGQRRYSASRVAEVLASRGRNG